MCSLQQWYANQYPRCPFVQAMTSRVTGSSRGTVELGRAWPACCPAGTRTTSFPSRVTIPRLPSCILHDLLREVLNDDFLLQTHFLPCIVFLFLHLSFLCCRVSASFTSETSTWLCRLLHQEGQEAASQKGESKLASSSSVENSYTDFVLCFLQCVFICVLQGSGMPVFVERLRHFSQDPYQRE